ncbi:MerR family transcriptional regulator [Nocardia sp. NPDC003482]
MAIRTAPGEYSIREAAALVGLPASTLRYYEGIGLVGPIMRGESSKQRIYTDDDIDLLVWVSCLSATGMSISDMQRYVKNGARGAAGAADQVRLLTAQRDNLARQAELLDIRRRYVDIKIEYWTAVAAGDEARAAALSDRARALADRLHDRPAS